MKNRHPYNGWGASACELLAKRLRMSNNLLYMLAMQFDYVLASVFANVKRSLMVLTTVIDKENVEGFATIVLYLASRSGLHMSEEQRLLCYQWLEHIAMYADQAATNPVFANNFLQDLNNALERCSYLTGNFLTIADVAAYHVLYPILEKLSSIERESLLHICRWSRHIQAQPGVMAGRIPLPLDAISINLSLLTPVAH